MPVVPYAWQEKGATLELPSFRGKYINVAGFYQTNHQRKMYFFEQETINAAKLVDIFDGFAKNITQKTVVALDNAPIHKSKLFQSKSRTMGKRKWFISIFYSALQSWIKSDRNILEAD